jgi:hypothetical protein
LTERFLFAFFPKICKRFDREKLLITMFKDIAEIMYFVPDRRAAADWYSKLFDTEITFLNNPEHFFIRVGDREVWFHMGISSV